MTTTTRPATICTCIEPLAVSNLNRHAELLVCQRCDLVVDPSARAPRDARAVSAPSEAPADIRVTAADAGEPRCHRCDQIGIHGGDGTDCIRALHAALAVAKVCASRAALVFALVAIGTTAIACRRSVHATPDAPHTRRWVLSDEADDDETFCVPSALRSGTAPADAFALRCTTVADIRRYVRGQRAADARHHAPGDRVDPTPTRLGVWARGRKDVHRDG